MPLGDHLDELRRRLIRIVAVVGVLMIVAFGFSVSLKTLVMQPLLWALQSVDPETLASLHIDLDNSRILRADSLMESPLTAVRISIYTALALAVPHLIWELWGFVSPALKPQEKSLGFLFVPAAVLFFYTGALIGYFIGLPTLYTWLIQWTLQDTTAHLEFRQTVYLANFFAMTIVCGAIMDIPWLVLVLIRVRLVTPQQLAKQRRYVIFGAIIAAAMVTPPDPVSQLLFFLPMILLFEAGLLAGRILYRNRDA